RYVRKVASASWSRRSISSSPMASYVLSVSPVAGFTVAMGIADLPGGTGLLRPSRAAGGGATREGSSERVLRQAVEKRRLRLDDHLTRPVQPEPRHPVQLRELLRPPRPRRPLHLERPRHDRLRVDVPLHGPRRHHLAAGLAHLAQRDRLPVRRGEAQLLLELPAGRLPG